MDSAPSWVPSPVLALVDQRAFLASWITPLRTTLASGKAPATVNVPTCSDLYRQQLWRSFQVLCASNGLGPEGDATFRSPTPSDMRVRLVVVASFAITDEDTLASQFLDRLTVNERDLLQSALHDLLSAA